MKFRVDPDVIKGLLLVAPKSDVRNYLEGIAVDCTKERMVLVATDGHILVAIPIPEEGVLEPSTDAGIYILPRWELENAKPIKAGRSSFRYDITIENDTFTLEGALKISAKLLDGTYPVWRRVVPTTLSGEVAQFDARLLAKLAKANALFGGEENRMYLHHNGNGTARVSGAPNALMLIMPMRHDLTNFPAETYSWSKE